MSGLIDENPSFISSGISNISEGSDGPEFVFASVIFHALLDTYSTNSDVECFYQLDESFTPHVDDYIGLFYDGSQDPPTCVSRVPCAEESLSGAKYCKVIFRSKDLPGDNLRYQFAYKTGDHETLGTSSTFRIVGEEATNNAGHDFVEVVYSHSDLQSSEFQTRIHVLEEGKKELEDRVALLENENNKSRRKLEDLLEENHALRKALEESKRLWLTLENSNSLTLRGLDSVRKIENQVVEGLEQLESCKVHLKKQAGNYRAVIKQMESMWKDLEKKNVLSGKFKPPSYSAPASLECPACNMDNSIWSSNDSVANEPSCAHREKICTSRHSGTLRNVLSSVNYTLCSAHVNDSRANAEECDKVIVVKSKIDQEETAEVPKQIVKAANSIHTVSKTMVNVPGELRSVRTVLLPKKCAADGELQSENCSSVSNESTVGSGLDALATSSEKSATKDTLNDCESLESEGESYLSVYDYLPQNPLTYVYDLVVQQTQGLL